MSDSRALFLDVSLPLAVVLQRQIESNRMEIDHTNYGYETSRREQARLHEELAREAHNRRTQEMQEIERVQEMGIDEFFRHDLRESQATVNEFTPNTGVARKSERCERLQGIPRCRISMQWKIVLRSQSTGRISSVEAAYNHASIPWPTHGVSPMWAPVRSLTATGGPTLVALSYSPTRATSWKRAMVPSTSFRRILDLGVKTTLGITNSGCT